MYAIQWEKKALKQLKRIEKNERISISQSVKALKNRPTWRNVKSLKNQKYKYRLRVGRYRVFFDLEETVKIVKIEEVKKRNERTY
jgi:mRNA-degrading endonuclease RelE of RelBE toxin-antitoxin system